MNLQEEVENRTVNLAITTTKLTSHLYISFNVAFIIADVFF